MKIGMPLTLVAAIVVMWVCAAGHAYGAPVREADWADAFEGMKGAAVIYDPSAREYTVYNRELADTRRSPCSTFKIISALLALERGVVDPVHSVRHWSGETYWNSVWNHDIELAEAFRTSCVWYFRRVIDEIGPEAMREELDKLGYGNRDISDWEGRANTNDDNRALTGFWIESSLKISPMEQVKVLERIFGGRLGYAESTLRHLKRIMKVPGTPGKNLVVYGKTGMGKDRDTAVDAWFAGMADTSRGPLYFCVYLGETPGKEISSPKAREIALRLLQTMQQAPEHDRDASKSDAEACAAGPLP